MDTQNSYLSRYGPILVNHGYRVIPTSPGKKYPVGLTNWQDIQATTSMVKRWAANGFAGGGVGVLAERTPGCDIDVLDPVVVDRIIDICSDVLGHSNFLERTGRFPKVLLAFRTEAPFGKVATPFFRDPQHDVPSRVEILGKGQQWVAYHIHPDTGEPYEWGAKTLAATPWEDLPTITLEQAREICQRVTVLFQELGWEQQGDGQTGSAGAGSLDALEAAVPPADLTDDQFRLLIDQEDVDDRDSWVRVGLICYHQYSGTEKGFEVWDDWSQTSDKYDAEDSSRVWASFSGPVTRAPITARTLIEKHKDLLKSHIREERAAGVAAGVIPPVEEGLLEHFLARYIFIERKNLVCDLTKPPNMWTTKIEEHKNRVANQRIPVPTPTKNDPDKVTITDAHKLWLRHPDRISAEGERYDPDKPARFTDDYGLDWINTFYLPPHTYTIDESRTGLFLKHVDYLINDGVDRDWFLDWLAYNIQYPGKRSMITPLHISLAHGTGRGWVVSLIEALLGKWNCSKVKLQVLVGEGSSGQFQDFFDRSLFCAVDEIRERKNKFEINDQLRDYLTEKRLEVNVKHGTKQTQDIYTNFFFMSNHPDALVITKADRRIYVMNGPHTPKPESYYVALYDYLDNAETVAQIYSLLMRRDLAAFRAKTVAPMNAAKLALVGASQNDTEQLYEELMADLPSQAMSIQQIKARLIQIHGGDPFDVDINESQLVKLLQHGGAVNYGTVDENGGRFRFRGERVRPWIFDKTREEYDRDWVVAQVERAQDVIDAGID